MPKPTSKVELLRLSTENFENLNSFIEQKSLKEQAIEFPEGSMNRNIRDILAHLHHWHLMMLEWYKVGMAGNKPDMPATGYTWKTTSQLNRWIQEKYETTDLVQVKLLLQQSFLEVQEIISRHDNDELFEKKRYKWTGSTSLGAYLTSASSSHYDWALKLIKRNEKLHKGLGK